MTRALESLAIAGCWVVAAVLPAGATHSLGPMPVVPVIAAERVDALLAAREPITLIDLRSVEQYTVSRLPRARSVPLSELRARSAEIPRDGVVIVYCTCRPGEDWQAYELLQVRGFRNIAVLAGGFSGWIERGYRVEDGTSARRGDSGGRSAGR